ncbi:MAG: hypothetical protein SFY56_09250 [Bacteroidota bacterium]|nr:hypothetical protein [Bacteroidota bacterium]
MKSILLKTGIFISLFALLTVSCKKKDKTKPTAFTIFDVSSPNVIGMLDNTTSNSSMSSFGFQVNVAGTQSVKAHVTVTDAAGTVLKDVTTDSFSNDQGFRVNVPIPFNTFVGPMKINVTDESGGNAVSAYTELSMDIEINKPSTQLIKGIPSTGDVSADGTGYGDFVDVMKIPNALAGDSVIVNFNHLSDPGKYADVYIYNESGVNVFSNTSVPNRGKSLTKLANAGTYYVYVLFNSNAGYQEHWYWLTWK